MKKTSNIKSFPKIVKSKELPQWIISSDKAAYYPFSNTIYTTKLRYIPHELLHWFACKYNINFMHKLIDWKLTLRKLNIFF
jgi:hypothetical protein